MSSIPENETEPDAVRSPRNYDSLKQELLSEGALFDDTQFPPNDRSVFKDGVGPGKLGSVKEPIIWKRPCDIVSDPKFMVEDFSRQDIDQGCLGNCWFLAGASILVNSHREMFERVVPPDQSFSGEEYTGMFRFNFYWHGKWVEVIIDDYLPTNGQYLLFSKCKETSNELWPCLLEKAYAKLRGSYEALSGGWIRDALVDMTGGISEVISLEEKEEVPPELYSLLFTSFQMNTLMGAVIFKKEEQSGDTAETQLDNGLCGGHAYSITGFRKISTEQHGTVNLLRLRNPWGRREWNGAWSDGSPEMESLSEELKDDLNFTARDEGEFWMSYEDFIENFHLIELCHFQPDAYIAELEKNAEKQMWNASVYHGDWVKGVSAGGCGNSPNQHLYWKNPQFFVTLGSPDDTLGHGDDCTLLVSLMEKENMSQGEICIGFEIYELKHPDLRPLDDSRAPSDALEFTCRSEYDYSREVTRRFELKPGTYGIIPSTFYPHEEATFMLRLFTEKHVDSGELEEDVNLFDVIDLDSLEDDINYDEAFARHAGSDERMDATELGFFLTEMSTTESIDDLQLPVESVRSLLTLMDENRSGYLNLSEAKRAWKKIKVCRHVFKHSDSDNTNAVDSYDLGTILVSQLGFSISKSVLTAVVRRYGGRDLKITLPDFVMIICKLSSFFASFREQQKKTGGDGDLAQFTRNEFLEVTMFI